MAFSEFTKIPPAMIYSYLSVLTEPGIYDNIKGVGETNIIVARRSTSQRHPDELRFEVLAEKPFAKTTYSHLYLVVATLFLNGIKVEIKDKNRIAKLATLEAFANDADVVRMRAKHEYEIAKNIEYFHMKPPINHINGKSCLIMRNLIDTLYPTEADFLDTLTNEIQGIPTEVLKRQFVRSICILKGVKKFHTEIQITHGDIKPENCMSQPNRKDIFLIDLVTAQDLTTTKPIMSDIITIKYAPPEAYLQNYPNRTKAYDAFSTGVLLAFLWGAHSQTEKEEEMLLQCRRQLINLRNALNNHDKFETALNNLFGILEQWKKLACPTISIATQQTLPDVIKTILSLKNAEDPNPNLLYEIVEKKLLILVTAITLYILGTCRFPNDTVKNIITGLMDPKEATRKSIVDAFQEMSDTAEDYYKPACLVM